MVLDTKFSHFSAFFSHPLPLENFYFSGNYHVCGICKLEFLIYSMVNGIRFVYLLFVNWMGLGLTVRLKFSGYQPELLLSSLVIEWLVPIVLLVLNQSNMLQYWQTLRLIDSLGASLAVSRRIRSTERRVVLININHGKIYYAIDI